MWNRMVAMNNLARIAVEPRGTGNEQHAENTPRRP